MIMVLPNTEWMNPEPIIVPEIGHWGILVVRTINYEDHADERLSTKETILEYKPFASEADLTKWLADGGMKRQYKAVWAVPAEVSLSLKVKV
jgi:hypothetical protein